ncbi:hypothetical protein CHS0354_009677 [Potamilus streckersoni]|uniref:Protein TBATA n=1 Tax=Potamilus streckersoni TaxID=2493646 RepID=A0AAE0SM13_9BIVA|nr:hypothetical protein CHS0354_009677 [Potamilus streckersoni]
MKPSTYQLIIKSLYVSGLLDVPICAVNDDGYFASPRYSLQFPPNAFNNAKLQNSRIPVNAINVNSTRHPINTITGLQYFTGLNSYPFREKAIPKIGLVPVTEAWRDELKKLTDGLQLEAQQPNVQEKKEPERPKTQYSETTGRIIPPPSRALSRGRSRSGSRLEQRMGNFQHIATEPDMETHVFAMLCQILQTEDINAVQAWLCSAGEREKQLVMDLIRTALSSQSDYYQRDYPTEFIEKENFTKLPPINVAGKPEENDTEKRVDRLVLHEGSNEVPKPQFSQNPMLPPQPPVPPLQAPPSMTKPIIDDKDAEMLDFAPPTSDAFKKPQSRMGRSPTFGGKKSPVKPNSATKAGHVLPVESNTLRYTKSAQGRKPAVDQIPKIAPGPAPVDKYQLNEGISENTF